MKRSIALFSALLLMAVVCPSGLSAEDRLAPKWLKKRPEPTNSSYEYVLQTSINKSLEKAQEGCFQSLVRDSGYGNGFVVKLSEESTLSVRSGPDSTSTSSTFDSKSEIVADEFKMYVMEVAQYSTRQRGMYRVTKLYQKGVGKTPPDFDPVWISSDYGMAPAFCSIVPGLGQFIKGDPAKGFLFLGSMAASFGGAALYAHRSDVAVDRARMSHDATVISTYNSQSTTCRTVSNVLLGLGAAVYICNILDAAIAPGADRIVVTPLSVKVNF